MGLGVSSSATGCTGAGADTAGGDDEFLSPSHTVIASHASAEKMKRRV